VGGNVVAVGTAVSVATGEAVGVRVAVNKGRLVLVGVGVTCDTPLRPTEQLNNTRLTKAMRLVNRSKRFLME
jgi:hypothetical protein